MRRIRIGVIGASALSEWGLLPVLLGPDISSPPDSGAWWSRRPVGSTAIQWQAPFRAEVIALCEADEERRARVAAMFRITAQYSDAHALLNENSLDAVFCEDASCANVPELVSLMAARGAKYLWLGGATAASSHEALELAHWAAAHGVRVWCGRVTRHAAAHRAALQLIKRGEIGDVTALALRWSTPFAASTEADAGLRAASFAAVDLLVAAAGVAPVAALLSEAKSTSHLWLKFSSGASATAVFSSADNWNAPLPRLEIIGTQGRFVVCEAGRRMGFFQPHEATRWIEPPGLAAHVSSAAVNGLAEDIKAFLGDCVSEKPNSENIGWLEVARVHAAIEAARRSLESGTVEPLEKLALHDGTPETALGEVRNGSTSLGAPVLTLPLA